MEPVRSEIVILVTASSQEEASLIGHKIVEAKLAACTNVVKDIRSVFRWEGKISSETECLLIIKSTLDRFSDLEQTIRRHHSYSVPEIIALPIVAGSAPYLEWLRSETQK